MPERAAGDGLYPAFAQLSTPWRACLEQAWESFRHGSLPIGAAVIDANDQVVALGRNRLSEPHAQAPHLPGTPYLTGSPLAHAELNALLQMGYDRPEPRPTLFTTTEPCPLCMGAARMAGVARVVFASRDVWAGASVMAESVPYLKRQGPLVEGPVPELEEPLVVLQLVRSGLGGASTPFSAAWRAAFPVACEVSEGLRASTVLHDLARQGGSVELAWGVVVGELAAAGSL